MLNLLVQIVMVLAAFDAGAVMVLELFIRLYGTHISDNIRLFPVDVQDVWVMGQWFVVDVEVLGK